VERAADDLRRRESLAESGAISREELNHARVAFENGRSALAAAEAGITAAREQLAGNRTLTEGTTFDQHPSVQAAAARMKEAWLAARRAVLTAPVDGQVARRTVQMGQKVAAGVPLMAVVPLHQVWVDANFKESQLRRIRIGQPVRVTADLYGDQVAFDGRVAGLGAGTGSTFALLPAQNATGNWIKVVQRIPVRVVLEPAQLAAHPLRVGLSMHASVDVRDLGVKPLADAPRMQEPPHSPVTTDSDAEAE